MEKIKEKPALSERVKEKAVSAPKELLRKVLDDGSERLRTQLRDTAQQGRRDEYGGDAIEDSSAGALRRAEKNLLKQRKKKTKEQSASPKGDASVPNFESDAPPVIRTRETDAARARAPSPPVRGQRCMEYAVLKSAARAGKCRQNLSITAKLFPHVIVLNGVDHSHDTGTLILPQLRQRFM